MFRFRRRAHVFRDVEAACAFRHSKLQSSSRGIEAQNACDTSKEKFSPERLVRRLNRLLLLNMTSMLMLKKVFQLLQSDVYFVGLLRAPEYVLLLVLPFALKGAKDCATKRNNVLLVGDSGGNVQHRCAGGTRMSTCGRDCSIPFFINNMNKGFCWGNRLSHPLRGSSGLPQFLLFGGFRELHQQLLGGLEAYLVLGQPAAARCLEPVKVGATH
mmetsp:Transcript_62774/g.149785  ORF Transcript_62774/g.149785 Transcript_62774/m.149785 type:complete len:214 (+) Transcript_62774:1785-2426(+)